MRLRFRLAFTFSFMFMFMLLLLLLLLFSLLTVLMTDTEKKVAAMRKPKKGKMTKVPQWPGSWPYLVGDHIHHQGQVKQEELYL